MEAINKRRSIRDFLDKEVEDDKIDLILHAAMQAPSAKNQQPWVFIIEKRKDVLNKLAELSPNARSLKTAALAIIYLADKEKFTVEAMFPQDMSASVTTSLIEAASLGIGSCWCGTYPREERMKVISEMYDVDYIPFAIVAYGYPKDPDALKFIDRFDESRILRR